MTRSLPTDERVQQLLADLASGEAGEEARAELRGLLGADAEAVIEEFELTAAAAELSMLGGLETMPASARERVEDAAREFIASGRAPERAGGAEAGPGAIPIGSAPDVRVSRGAPMALAVGGWLAAAACLVLAAIGWIGVVVNSADRAPERSAAERRQALLDSDPDVVTAGWIGVGDLPVDGLADHPLDHGVSGDVVWSDARDEGYMRISGVGANDPSEFQYQLWIFDADRRVGDLPQFAIPGLPDLLTQRPVDGGVFDLAVGADGEAIVPIDAKLPIGAGTIFAVTKEPPGGVVVSDREIVFLAVRG